MNAPKEAWGTRIGLILAMAGNAVGLGNFLRFPVQAVQNGGGAFIIPYLTCFLLLGIPLLMIEWSIGRYGGQYGFHTTPFTMRRMGGKQIWLYLGTFGIFSNIAIASYYCYIESWTLSYTFHSLAGTFQGMGQDEVAGFFTRYTDVGVSTTGIPYEAVIFFLICLALNAWILSKGLSGGVEKAAKIVMPTLIVFGAFLAIEGILLKAGHNGAVNDGTVGLNFLWTPNYDSLSNPKVWLAAAGQVFFTLSLGQGSVQCFASYVRKKDDIALNAMSAGWMNEFVEVVLGSAIIIPIAIGYLGIDRVVELTQAGGLGLGFRTMPSLFQNWGPLLAALSGMAFFGLLFFAGITSSLAMGTPILSFLRDEFNWGRKQAALFFGGSVMVLGLPTVFFFQQGVLDEYDYWAGSVCLVVFAMIETVLFSWVFGIRKGWKELTAGADIKIPGIYRFIIRWITPMMLIAVFFGSLIRPAGDDWSTLSFRGWELHRESIIGQITHQGIGPNSSYFSKEYYSETEGVIDSLYIREGRHYIAITDLKGKTLEVRHKAEVNVKVEPGMQVMPGDVLYTGKVINKVFYTDLARGLLFLVFMVNMGLIFLAYKKRKRNGTL
jgi:SNF family Na+-dependent transporter